MTKRDKLFLSLGVSVAAVGVVALILELTSVGLALLFFLCLVLLVLLLLQRKQIAAVQKRTLQIIRTLDSFSATGAVEVLDYGSQEVEESLRISSKKIVGLLQAQQKHIDQLSNRLDRIYEESFDKNARTRKR